MIATNPSGLQATTFYYFKVNGSEYSILTPSPAPTYQQVANLMDAAVTGAGFEVKIMGVAPNQDIRVTNIGQRGWESFVTLAFGTSGPNLWINLTGFVGFDTAVPGRGAFSLDLIPAKPIGGLVSSGAAITSFSAIAPVGSIIMSGAVTVQVHRIYTVVTAAITVSGAAFYKKGYIYTSSGSAILSGIAPTSKPQIYTASGTIIMSGVAGHTIVRTYTASGAIITSGAAVTTHRKVYAYVASGTAATTGTGVTSYTKVYAYIMVPGTGGEAGALHVINAETGNTSQWTTLFTTGGTITADAAALDHGSYGFKYLANGSSSQFAAIKNVNNLVDVHVRLYINLFNFQSSFGTADWVAIRYGTQRIAEVQFKRRTGFCGYALLLDTGSGLTTVYDQTGSNVFADNTWYYIELHWRRRTYDGGIQFWINGASQYSDFTKNTSNVPYIDSVRVGQLNLPAQTNGSTIYVDDVLIDDYYIGAYASTIASPKFTGAAVTSVPKEYRGLFYGQYYYPFDSMAGTTAYDKFTSANHITLNSANVWYSAAKFYGSAKFDKAHWGTLSSDVNPLAISFWHKWKIDNQNSYRVVAASADDSHWYFAFEPGYFRAVIRDNTNYYTFLNGSEYYIPPDDDQWHFYYIDFYSGSNAQLYVDNVYRGQVTNFFNTNTYKLHTIGNGGDDGASGIYGFGPLDDLRVYTLYRLTPAQRTEMYIYSPYLGGVIIGGAAQVRPVIIAGETYNYIGKGGIVLSGSRYRYLYTAVPTAITLSGSITGRLGFSFSSTGTANAEGASAFHDFGLGYVYDIVTGGVAISGAAITSATVNYSSYIPTGGIALTSQALYSLIIETSYMLVFYEVGRMRLSGAAIKVLTINAKTPTGGTALSGTIKGTIGKVAPTPTGKAQTGGAAITSWAPNSGYQELGL